MTAHPAKPLIIDLADVAAGKVAIPANGQPVALALRGNLAALAPEDAYVHSGATEMRIAYPALGPHDGPALDADPPKPDGYSSRFNVWWSDADRAGLAGWLTLLARDVMAGRVEIRGARYSFYHQLGTDVDGTAGVNLDSGDRTFEFVYHRPADKQV